jgi:hypothetical protein
MGLVMTSKSSLGRAFMKWITMMVPTEYDDETRAIAVSVFAIVFVPLSSHLISSIPIISHSLIYLLFGGVGLWLTSQYERAYTQLMQIAVTSEAFGLSRIDQVWSEAVDGFLVSF